LKRKEKLNKIFRVLPSLSRLKKKLAVNHLSNIFSSFYVIPRERWEFLNEISHFNLLQYDFLSKNKDLLVNLEKPE